MHGALFCNPDNSSRHKLAKNLETSQSEIFDIDDDDDGHIYHEAIPDGNGGIAPDKRLYCRFLVAGG